MRRYLYLVRKTLPCGTLTGRLISEPAYPGWDYQPPTDGRELSWSYEYSSPQGKVSLDTVFLGIAGVIIPAPDPAPTLALDTEDFSDYSEVM